MERRYYDDVGLVSKHYDKVKLYADSLTLRAAVMDRANHTLLDSGGWGDWMAPTGKPTPDRLEQPIVGSAAGNGATTPGGSSSGSVRAAAMDAVTARGGVGDGDGGGSGGTCGGSYEYISALRTVVAFANGAPPAHPCMLSSFFVS